MELLAAAAAAEVLHPVWRDPLWVTAVTSGLAAIIGAVAGLLTRSSRQDRKLDEAAASAERAAASSEAAREGISNNHNTHLRDDLDRIMQGVDILLHTQEVTARRLDEIGQRLELHVVDDDDWQARVERRLLVLEETGQ
ncbi:hypothetical protein D5R93_05655 [Actinomyces lilanjuaniae]|uniref:DUF2746 domain-containing protein n=1 Tax=Actinomyces lilanjuaniae TaxID=2321394 RepID=A0ABM6Z337_9ACTO|nr:hypothetical protein [Actinomyces lilanjuaniae]AYD89657.1 hypothetical protein D5R93_05655 [Actinomyces lilanjuaniae]